MNPRRVIATKYQRPGGAPQTAAKPSRPRPEPNTRPTPKALPGPTEAPQEPAGSDPSPDRMQPCSTRLNPDEIDKLDRIVARLSGRVEATRSFGLRWLVQQFDETTID